MGLAILTRDDAAFVYAQPLEPMEVIAMPVTRTEPPPDPDALARALAEPHDAILVASARGAIAVLEEARKAGTRNGRAITMAEVWAVGPATQLMFVNARTGEYANAASLARALLAARGPNIRVLVPRAEGGREEAIEILRAAGAHVIDVIAYRTVPVSADDPSIADGLAALPRADVVVFFAPSQVAALAALTDLVALRQCVAIGETTAAALRERGIEPAVAAEPTPRGIANAVASVYPRTR
jgi:uroporphyrinogen-III synthase